MVDRMIKFAGLLLLLVVQPLSAEMLSDPTRPAATLEVGEAVGSATLDDVSQTQGLHLIIIKKNRRAAIIDGQTVELGGKVGDARLVEVHEDRVVLLGSGGRREMKLYPRVSIRRADKVITSRDGQAPASAQSVITNKEKK